MKNHGFLLLFLISLGWVYAQQPVNSSVNKVGDENTILHTTPWSATADQNPARHADVDGVSFLTVGKDGSLFYVKDFFEGAIGKVFYRASAKAEEQLIFEPDAYASAGDQIYTVAGLYPDLQSRKIAIALSSTEKERCDLVMVDLDSRVIDNYVSGISSKRISWMPDGEHVLYHRWASDNVNDSKFRIRTKTYLHRLGTPEEEDVEYFSARVSDQLDIGDAEIPAAFYSEALHAVIGLVQTEDNLLKIYLQKGDLYAPSYWEPLALEADRVHDFCVGDRFLYYKTDKEAENFRLLASQYRWPDISNAEEVVAEYPNEVITDFASNSNGLYFATRNAEGEIKLYFKSPKRLSVEPVSLPVRAKQITIETIDPKTPELWLHIWEDNFWEVHYRYETETGAFERYSLEETSGTDPVN